MKIKRDPFEGWRKRKNQPGGKEQRQTVEQTAVNCLEGERGRKKRDGRKRRSEN